MVPPAVTGEFAAPLDRVELAKAPLPYEQLDQLTMEVLMGVR